MTRNCLYDRGNEGRTERHHVRLAPKSVTPVEAVEPASDTAQMETHPLSDEGVLFEYITTDVIVNFTDAETDVYNAHRRELHVNGRVFQHVAEDPHGHWLYRLDR